MASHQEIIPDTTNKAIKIGYNPNLLKIFQIGVGECGRTINE